MLLCISQSLKHMECIQSLTENCLYATSEESAKLIIAANDINNIITDIQLTDVEYFKKKVSNIVSYDVFVAKITSYVKLKEKKIADKNAKVENHDTKPVKTVTSSHKNTGAEIQRPTENKIINEKSTQKEIPNATIKHSPLKEPIKRPVISNKLIILVTSCKGGTGKTLAVENLAKHLLPNESKLIVDLNFYDGGSDLSYDLHLPKLPHIGSYILGNPDNLKDYLLEIGKNTYILQAPPKVSLVSNLTSKDISNVCNNFNGKIIIVDMPYLTDDIGEYLKLHSNVIYVMSNGSIADCSRINETFKAHYKKTRIVLWNNQFNQYQSILPKLNFKFTNIKSINEVSEIVRKDFI